MDNYVYHDRKMMKWMPFNALLEQGDYLKELLNKQNRKTMPSLSEDQLMEMNYNLESAFVYKEPVHVLYYQDGDYERVEGIIRKIDPYHKTIQVGNKTIPVQVVIEITI